MAPTPWPQQRLLFMELHQTLGPDLGADTEKAVTCLLAKYEMPQLVA